MTKPRRISKSAALLAVVVVTAAACGDNGGGRSAPTPRTLDIEMRDTAFAPDQVEVAAGEAVRLVFHNRGAIAHDAYIGDEAAQDAHEMEMRDAESGDGGGMDHGGHGAAGDQNAITVEPGETGELTYTFEEGDQLLIGCHQSGHYEAGMRLTIDVSRQGP